MTGSLRIFLGDDPREHVAYQVAEASMRRHTTTPVSIEPLSLHTLGSRYTRPTARREGRLWDVLSDAPMSTAHANARFFVPELAGFEGWALWADGDILLRDDVAKLFALADDRFAVMVVQHAPYTPAEPLKMDRQIQLSYHRKNWSSVVLWNCAHPSHQLMVRDDGMNLWPGRDLHAFCWLSGYDIGAIPLTWNHLVGVTQQPIAAVQLAHFTLGTPDMPGYETGPFTLEWRQYACGLGHHDWVRVLPKPLLSGEPSSVPAREFCRFCRTAKPVAAA